jgi:transcriptional regulator with XRE-family HTH domain
LQLTAERLRRGWSQAELARRSGMNATTISLIESGRFRPYRAQLVKLARALGLDEESANSLLFKPGNDYPARDWHPRGATR